MISRKRETRSNKDEQSFPVGLLVFTHDPKAKPVKVAKADIKSVTASPVSQMPPGLINALNEKELADLVAYLLSGGNKKHRVYK